MLRDPSDHRCEITGVKFRAGLLKPHANWWNPVLAEPLQVEQGMAIVKGITGTGVAWNEQTVERFLA